MHTLASRCCGIAEVHDFGRPRLIESLFIRHPSCFKVVDDLLIILLLFSVKIALSGVVISGCSYLEYLTLIIK